MEKPGMKESTEQEVSRRKLLILVDKQWEEVAFRGTWTNDEIKKAIKNYRNLGYRTRLLPFIELRLCICGICAIRENVNQPFDIDHLGQPCTKVYATPRNFSDFSLEAILIGLTYK
jgi:hypothetical protein